MEAKPRGQTVKPDTTDSFVVRLPDQHLYGDIYCGGWTFLAVDPSSAIWVPFNISREGELEPGSLLFNLHPKVSLALHVYKSRTKDRTTDRTGQPLLIQTLISSMCWVGIEVEVSAGSHRMYPYLKDFSAEMFNALVDAIAEVFGDQQFASEVFSRGPAVKVVE